MRIHCAAVEVDTHNDAVKIRMKSCWKEERKEGWKDGGVESHLHKEVKIAYAAYFLSWHSGGSPPHTHTQSQLLCFCGRSLFGMELTLKSKVPLKTDWLNFQRLVGVDLGDCCSCSEL